ncbi:hypothetical protein AB0F68_06870 [Micromonospora sp. NPDC023966]|uniref:hypothetical protein n=1 Tax=Micromonospora sp. NPDC023966 TaxID=3154699 RepID=UPI0033F824CF
MLVAVALLFLAGRPQVRGWFAATNRHDLADHFSSSPPRRPGLAGAAPDWPVGNILRMWWWQPPRDTDDDDD